MATIPMSILKVDGQDYEVVDKSARDSIDSILDLSNYQTTGSIDKQIYDALDSLGWLSDCTES